MTVSELCFNRQFASSKKALRHQGVNVNHLNRCKTSTRLVAGGHGSIHQSVDQLHVPALFPFHFFVKGNRLSPEPACRNLHFSVVTRGILHLELRSKRELQNSFLKWISFIKNFVFLMKNYVFFYEKLWFLMMKFMIWFFAWKQLMIFFVFFNCFFVFFLKNFLWKFYDFLMIF